MMRVLVIISKIAGTRTDRQVMEAFSASHQEEAAFVHRRTAAMNVYQQQLPENEGQ